MDKAYEPSQHETRIYKLWERSGAFAPSSDSMAEPYTILMPPPNANADLHLGQTLTTALEDIMVRYARMNGKATLFVPGADHAGFETQVVFERHLATLGKSRFDFSRPQLYQQIWDFVQVNKRNMEDQQRRIGASVDWQRNTFTLDPHVVRQAYQTFKKLSDDGLLYRGKRIVNYCTFHGTSFSDLEVEYSEEQSHLWYFKYPVCDSQEFITVATTRPETMLGDTGVAVHPNDKRYKHLVGKLVRLPLANREIPVVADNAIDPAFGTGAVKVTPAHDPLDFEVGERHKLPAVEVIGHDGRMTTAVPPAYQGLDVAAARKAVVKALTDQGFHVKTQDYTHSVGHCYKCGSVIQPLLMDQWLIRMQPLAQRAIQALENQRIAVVPHSKTKVLFQWLENIHDWNISRQIVWGIPIPAFIAEDNETIIDLEEAGDTINRGGKTYYRDPDTFDTWFSSGQWPEATLHYPDSKDFQRFYPITVMETAAEIIFFWVARMIMLGLYLTDKVPFTTVYLHGLVTDEHGKKMSKSRGNVLAPTPLLEKYGADALRMGIVAHRSAGLNQGFSEKRVEAYRNFCNKLWNVARFTLDKLPDDYSPTEPKPTGLADKWILTKFSRENAAISKAIASYRFSEATEKVYSLLWDDFADWYIEASKVQPNLSVLVSCLETMLKLAHPFAPFITEAIWQNMPWQKDNLIVSDWPESSKRYREAMQFENIIALVSQIRSIVADLKLSHPVLLYRDSSTLADNAPLIRHLARVGELRPVGQGSGLRVPSQDFSCWLDIDAATIQTYRSQLQRKRHEVGEYGRRLAAQLSNQRYVARAPKELVQQTRDRVAEAKLLLSQLDEQIGAIEDGD